MNARAPGYCRRMSVPIGPSLSAQLAAYAADGAAGAPAPAEDLEVRLRAMLALGRQSWPALPLSDEEFLRHLADRLPEGIELAAALENLHAADLFLACACTLQKPQALTAFDRHCLGELP